MQLFRKQTYTIYSSETPEALQKILIKNISSWNDFSNFQINKSKKLYEGIVSNNTFTIRKKLFGNTQWNPIYEGEIIKLKTGSAIVLEKKLPLATRTILSIFLIVFSVFTIFSTYYWIQNRKIDFHSFVFSWGLLIIIMSLIRFTNPRNFINTYNGMKSLFTE